MNKKANTCKKNLADAEKPIHFSIIIISLKFPACYRTFVIRDQILSKVLTPESTT